ncbi:MAG TPA: 4a-hydroxytetrahydrobiopterin dehydratase [Bacteroidota bacterium]|nr:4a-hydroxytetrahydrobiopterin dehydratase [Bacteroidota bacterium]
MSRLTEKEIEQGLGATQGWQREGDEIVRVFVFDDFVRAMGFVNSTALLAEKMNHHPDIDIRWNKVTLRLSTHSAGGLTSKDFDLAGQINALQPR